MTSLAPRTPVATTRHTMLPGPWLLFLGDVGDPIAAKTATAIAYWRPEHCVGQARLPGCAGDSGLEDLSFAEAARRGAKTMIVGTVNVGGTLPPHWHGAIVAALEAGLDIASGLHAKLADIPEVRDTATRLGRHLFDVRALYSAGPFPPGSGDRRSGRRLLTVGTDCSVGKMFTALAIEAEMRRCGMDADFRATGQTGIMIAGAGVCTDAVVADFVSGAIEELAPANHEDHWDVIEGQGSLFHPACAGVALDLIHGAQPEALVLCHEPTRTHMRGLPGRSLPEPGVCGRRAVEAARLTNPAAELIGVSVNTSLLAADAAQAYIERLELDFGVPCVDPVRTGVSRIVNAL